MEAVRTRATFVTDARVLAPAVVAVVVGWIAMVVYPMRHDLQGFIASWAIMTGAMMVPTVLRPMKRIARGRASRAIAFSAGYLAVWVGTAFPAWIVMTWLPMGSMGLAVAWIGVGAYAQTPVALRSFRSCKSLPETGVAAFLGVRQGLSCVVGCAPLMIVAMATVMQMNAGPLIASLVMFALMWLMLWQKSPRASDSALRAVGVALIIGGAVLGVSGGFTGHEHVG